MNWKWALSIFCTVFSAYIQASGPAFANKEKKYISPEKILIKDHTILVFLDNQWTETSSIHCDESGIYVDSIKILPWQCPNCHRWTNGWFCCEHCGYVPD